MNDHQRFPSGLSSIVHNLRKPNKTCSKKSYRTSIGFNGERQLFTSIRKFSNGDFHRPGILKLDQPIILEFSFDEGIVFKFYANGASREYEGYVSVVISYVSGFRLPIPFEFSCVISVEDVRGNRRYSQSLAISRDRLYENEETIGRFVSRKSLLSEQSDLLPEDILTFCVDFYYADYVFGPYYSNPLGGDHLRNFFKIIYEKKKPDEELDFLSQLHTSQSNVKLYGEMHLDSCHVQKLAEHSEYFQALLRTEMREKEKRTIKLDLDEAVSLKNITLVMNGEFCDDVRPSLFHWYKTAHKYLMQTALDMVREGMIHILCADTIDMISEVAQEYDDHYLKKIIKKFDGKAFYREEVYMQYPSYSIKRRSTKIDPVALVFNEIKQCDFRPDLNFYK